MSFYRIKLRINSSKRVTIISIFFIFSVILHSTDSYFVPKKQLMFEKVLEIKEKDDRFYFKSLRKIIADKEENVYALDANRILKFSRSGDYITNLIPRGAGPGESNEIWDFFLINDNLFVQSNVIPKIIRKDKNGSLLKEIRINRFGYLYYIHYYNGAYYFWGINNLDKMNNSNGSVTNIMYDLLITGDLKKFTSIASFPLETFFKKSGSSNGMIRIAELITAQLGGRYLVISNTTGYNLKLFDLQTQKIIRQFGIPYQRVEFPKDLYDSMQPSILEIEGNRAIAPKQKYWNDIKTLLIHQNDIWVVTSTYDKKKGTRVDVYNSKGDFKDSFFLNLPGRSVYESCVWCITGNYLYVAESPEDGDPHILKYKIKL